MKAARRSGCRHHGFPCPRRSFPTHLAVHAQFGFASSGCLFSRWHFHSRACWQDPDEALTFPPELQEPRNLQTTVYPMGAALLVAAAVGSILLKPVQVGIMSCVCCGSVFRAGGRSTARGRAPWFPGTQPSAEVCERKSSVSSLGMQCLCYSRSNILGTIRIHLPSFIAC